MVSISGMPDSRCDPDRSKSDGGDHAHHAADAAGALTPLAALVAAATGPLPDYHPACLRAALLLGRPDMATAALRALLRVFSDDNKMVKPLPSGSQDCC